MSAANQTRRLQKEVQDLVKDTHSGITLTTPQDGTDFKNLTHFKGSFYGPPDTPYEGGKYDVDIKITPEYPFKPPIMRFITRIWHPNVSSQTGAICLDTLSQAWSPVLTLKSALISLQSLLSSPEPKDPQDAEVATMLISRPDEFRHVAQQWAIRYAGAPEPEPGSKRSEGSSSGIRDEADLIAKMKAQEEEQKRREEQQARVAYQGYNPQMVQRFTAMGFSIERVVAAFDFVGIDKIEDDGLTLDEEYVEEITARLVNEV